LRSHRLANSSRSRSIAEEVGLRESELEYHGPYIAKVKLEVRDRLAKQPNGKYVE